MHQKSDEEDFAEAFYWHYYRMAMNHLGGEPIKAPVCVLVDGERIIVTPHHIDNPEEWCSVEVDGVSVMHYVSADMDAPEFGWRKDKAPAGLNRTKLRLKV